MDDIGGDIDLYVHGYSGQIHSNGGWGAMFKIHIRNRCSITQQHCGPLGLVSSTSAEYLSMIRATNTLCEYIDNSISQKPKRFNIRIHSVHSLSTSQLLGHSKVQAKRLKPLYMVTIGLLRRFRNHQVILEDKKSTPAEDVANLAKCGAQIRPVQRKFCPIFRPSLMSLVKTQINGIDAIASHDLYSITNGIFLIDSLFLKSLPQGDIYLQLLRDCSPIQLISSGIDMTPIGIISLSVKVFWDNGEVETKDKIDFIVMDSLPVQVHLTVLKEELKGYEVDFQKPLPKDVIPFDNSEVPKEYRNHPYWQPNRPNILPDEYFNPDGSFKGIVISGAQLVETTKPS